jgi:hypothetical protein
MCSGGDDLVVKRYPSKDNVFSKDSTQGYYHEAGLNQSQQDRRCCLLTTDSLVQF